MAITNCRMIDFDAVLFEKDKQNTNSSPPPQRPTLLVGQTRLVDHREFFLKGRKKMLSKGKLATPLLCFAGLMVTPKPKMAN